MKRAFILCSVLAVVISTSSVFAAEKNTFYIGGALGGLKNDYSASLFIDDPEGTGNIRETAPYKENSPTSINITFLAGFNIFPWLAAELQYATTMKDKLLGSNLELSTQTAGLFGVYTAGDELFAKVRLGLAQRNLEFSTEPAFGSQSAVTGALGFSVGQELPVGTFEIMYMYYPKMKIDSDDLDVLTDIKFSDRVDTNTWSVAYTYTF